MLKAAIFDLDGLLVDSEPLWRRAEIEAFAAAGIELTPDLCGETIGLRTDEVVSYWFERHPWNETALPLKQVERRIERGVIARLRSECPRRPGVEHAICFFEGKGLRLGVASSSPMSLIRSALECLGVEDRFGVLHSAESETKGKPHPAVYLGAARRLGVGPAECVALEDSAAGLMSASGAGMSCVAVPDESLRVDERLALADVVLGSLAELDDGVWERLVSALSA